MKICFFANLSKHSNWREMFEKVEFYKLDIEILRSMGHEVVLAGDMKSFDKTADLYFCWWWTYAFFPVVQSIVRRKPVVVTGAFDYDTCRGVIPGLNYLDRPWWQRALINVSLRAADANLFISECEYEKVTSNLKVRNAKLCQLAINTEYYTLSPVDTERGNYFFTVSWSSKTNAQRKCLEQIIKAFGKFSEQNPSMRLVMAGKKGDYYEQLVALAKACGVADRVEFPGMISDAEKVDHYHRCAAYVQPTLFEGFGHAIGEAVACGARVITSPSGAVPEVAGDHADFVEPDNVDQLVEAMHRAVATPHTREAQEKQFAHIEKHFSIEVRRKRLEAILEQCGPRVVAAQRATQR